MSIERIIVNGRELTAFDMPAEPSKEYSVRVDDSNEVEVAELGRGTCKLERHGSLADQPSMVCWSCSECGFGWHHSINDKQFSYCPNCGRKVEQ